MDLVKYSIVVTATIVDEKMYVDVPTSTTELVLFCMKVVVDADEVVDGVTEGCGSSAGGGGTIGLGGGGVRICFPIAARPFKAVIPKYAAAWAP